jgi:hypothetical protein
MHDQSKHATASLARMVGRLIVLYVAGIARRRRRVIRWELDRDRVASRSRACGLQTS